MGARRFVSLLVACLCVVVGCVLFSDAAAQAGVVHEYASSFGSKGTGPGQFEEPWGIAVNNTTHDVYVVDHANDRVEEFNSTGSTIVGEFNGSGAPTGIFSEPTLIAVDNSENPLDPSAGDVYVVDSGHDVIDKFNPAGIYEGQLTGTSSGPFGSIVGVAVDPSGVVWVDELQGDIDSFTDALANQYLSKRRTTFGGALHPGLAVDSEDNIYFNPGKIEKTNSSGEILISPPFDSEEAAGVAVDSVAGDVYVDNFGTIQAFSLNGAAIERFGAGHLTDGGGSVAVDVDNGTVYVTDTSANKVAIFNAVPLPSVGIDAVTEQRPTSVTLNGTVTPGGKPVTSCTFEYGTTSAYGQSTPCSPSSPGEGATPVAVSADLTGLTPESTYHYRLVATNEGGSSPTLDRELVTGPVLGRESVSDVASSSATLQAPIDPNGDDTHYYVQYGTTPSYGTDAPVSPPGVDLGSSEDEQIVSLHLQELQSSTLYHYRFVTVQNGETFPEPDQSFTTQNAGGELPMLDGRTWELVSPPDKKGALIQELSHGGLIQAASDGSGITYTFNGSQVGENAVGRAYESQALSVRVPGGWRSQDLTLPSRPLEGIERVVDGFYTSEYDLFSPNLSQAAVDPQRWGTPPLSPDATERTLYLRNNANDSFLPLVTPADVPPGTQFGGEVSPENQLLNEQMHFLAATPDLSHVVFESPFALTPEATVMRGCKECILAEHLYEWSKAGLQLVSILPNGEQPMVPYVGHWNEAAGHTVSADGRWIVWQNEPYGDAERESLVKGLFVRDMVEEKTVQLGDQHAQFETMSSDGSKIFFLDGGRLKEGDLYVYDRDTDTQTDLTGNHAPGESNSGVKNGVLASQDGSYVYFVATGVLANGAIRGEDNLYVSNDNGGAWSTTYIATLSPADEKSWAQDKQDEEGGYEEDHLQMSGVSSRVSPDGRYMSFMSNRSLTGYDNVDAVSGQPDEEVYLYDAFTGRLVCSSCDPTGARPVGVRDDARLRTSASMRLVVDPLESWAESAHYSERQEEEHWLAGNIPGWDNVVSSSGAGGVEMYQPRYLSDSGRLFFNSPDALVPQDTNGLEDVYEYEPAGVGSCTTLSSTFSEVSSGCVNLISSGTSSAESAFYDASETGDDVFFITTSKLAAADYDTGYDVYDAHVCSTSVPCVAAVVSPPPCTSGDSCKAAPSPQPEIFGPAPSATFSGAGNVVEERKAAVKPKKSSVKHRSKAKKRGTKKKSRGKTRKARRSRTSIASRKGIR